MTRPSNHGFVAAWQCSFLVPCALALLGSLLTGRCRADQIGEGKPDASPAALTITDIALSKAVPKQGDAITITVAVKNVTRADLKDVRVNVSESLTGKPSVTKLPAKIQPSIKAGATAEVGFDWKPRNNGMYQLTASAEAGAHRAKRAREIAVVVRDLYFVWYGSPQDCYSQGLRYANVALADGDPDTVRYWKSRGFLPAHFAPWNPKQSSKEYSAFLADILRRGQNNALVLDEIPARAAPTDPTVQGLVQFARSRKEVSCFLFITPHVPNSDLIRALTVSIVDQKPQYHTNVFLMPELYYDMLRTHWDGSHTPYRAIERALAVLRDNHWLHGTIPAMTTGSYKFMPGYPDPAIFEDQIRFFKRHAHECPGVCFVDAGTGRAVNKRLDALCFKYYIQPVLNLFPESLFLSNYTPQVDEQVTIQLHLANIGGMDARDVTVDFFAADACPKQKIGSFHFPVVEPKFDKHHVAKVSWRPPKQGYYRISAEIDPNVHAAILDGQVTKVVVVKKQGK